MPQRNAEPSALLKVLSWTVLVTTAALAAFCFLNVFSLLRNPYPDSYGDGLIATFIDTFVARGTYFLDITQYPYIYSPYPPVFFILAGALFKLFGSSFFIVRALSFLFSLLTAFLVFRIIRLRTQNTVLSWTCAGLYFAPFYMFEWAASGRGVDMMAIFLSTLGLFLYLKDPKKLLWPTLLFILTFFTRQSVVAAPLAVFLDLLLNRKETRRAVQFIGVYAAANVGLMALLSVLTHGQAYLHLIYYNKLVGIIWENVATKYVRFFRPLGIMTAFAVYGLLTKKKDILGIYFALNALLLVTAGKDGAAANYFIEPLLSVLLFGGCMLHEALLKNERSVALGLLLLLFQAVSLMENPRHYFSVLSNALHPNYTEQERLSAYVRNAHGEVLSEDIGYLTMNKKTVLLEDPFYFAKLAQGGMWDQSRLLADCRNRRFALIIAGERLKDIPGMTDCLKNYTRCDTVLDMDVYK